MVYNLCRILFKIQLMVFFIELRLLDTIYSMVRTTSKGNKRNLNLILHFVYKCYNHDRFESNVRLIIWSASSNKRITREHKLIKSLSGPQYGSPDLLESSKDSWNLSEDLSSLIRAHRGISGRLKLIKDSLAVLWALWGSNSLQGLTGDLYTQMLPQLPNIVYIRTPTDYINHYL